MNHLKYCFLKLTTNILLMPTQLIMTKLIGSLIILINKRYTTLNKANAKYSPTTENYYFQPSGKSYGHFHG